MGGDIINIDCILPYDLANIIWREFCPYHDYHVSVQDEMILNHPIRILNNILNMLNTHNGITYVRLYIDEDCITLYNIYDVLNYDEGSMIKPDQEAKYIEIAKNNYNAIYPLDNSIMDDADFYNDEKDVDNIEIIKSVNTKKRFELCIHYEGYISDFDPNIHINHKEFIPYDYPHYYSACDASYFNTMVYKYYDDNFNIILTVEWENVYAR